MRRAARWTVGIALTGLTLAIGPVPREQLVAEQREGHARVLTACGTKKACIRKRRVPRTVLADVAPLEERDSSGTRTRRRWSEAQYDSVTVWIAPGEDVPLWRPVDRTMVRDAFHGWTAAGAPVRFVFVPDSLRADVRVLWRDSLAEGRAGQVTRWANSEGWLRAAVIEMSTRNLVGGAQDSVTMHSVALHEIGHLLGLEHSRDERDIMAPWVVAQSLTTRDRFKMRVLYDLAAPGKHD
jgi:hypothetical protein